MKYSLKKYAAWLPAILIAAVIFMLSNQPADESTVTSNGIIEIFLNFISRLKIIDPEKADMEALYSILEFPIRKGAHITEFAVLNLSFLFALFVWDMRGKKLYWTGFILTVLYACSDEIHQLFIPGRAGMIRDVFIDSIGPGIIMVCYYLHKRLGKHFYFHRQ